MNLRCGIQIHFCAGHRLLGHEGKCLNLHGHNYIAELSAEAPELDAVGRVIDFSELKLKVGGWIKDHWDHGFIRAENDEMVAQALSLVESKEFILPYNTTAENLAIYLLHEVCPKELKGTGITVTCVKLWETPSCFAECSL